MLVSFPNETHIRKTGIGTLPADAVFFSVLLRSNSFTLLSVVESNLPYIYYNTVECRPSTLGVRRVATVGSSRSGTYVPSSRSVVPYALYVG